MASFHKFALYATHLPPSVTDCLSIQDPVLFTGTIASNIAYGHDHATQEQIETAAREANCEFIWGMPQGFETQSEWLTAEHRV